MGQSGRLEYTRHCPLPLHFFFFWMRINFISRLVLNKTNVDSFPQETELSNVL